MQDVLERGGREQERGRGRGQGDGVEGGVGGGCRWEDTPGEGAPPAAAEREMSLAPCTTSFHSQTQDQSERPDPLMLIEGTEPVPDLHLDAQFFSVAIKHVNQATGYRANNTLILCLLTLAPKLSADTPQRM